MSFSGNIRKKIIFFSSDFSPFKVITNITKLTRLGNFQTKKFSYHLKNLNFDKCIERIWTIMLSHVFFITSCSYNSQVQTEQHPLLLLKDIQNIISLNTKYVFLRFGIIPGITHAFYNHPVGSLMGRFFSFFHFVINTGQCNYIAKGLQNSWGEDWNLFL